jgi:glycosyltransferase involved in cell wall biosynthesis
LLAKIKELCIEDYVTVHAPSSQIVKEYHNADALCLPSIYEGYPNVLCEAMSCGLPVICSNVVELPRIVKDAENGYLFDPYNPESIADAIARLLNTSEIELADMSKTNRAKILRNNTEDAFVEKYIELINESAPKSLSKISINKF